jgi:hypothetical protein
MSGSMKPGPSARRRRRVVLARFWLLMALSCVWINTGNIGMPGPRRRRGGSTKCPKCPERALRQVDGSYKCPNGHISRKKVGKGKERK